jgi:F-type H+-transporting ATPase subunit epsilon
MHTLKISIIGTDKIAYEGEAESAFVPTKAGIIEILPNHTQLVSALAPGEIILKTKEGNKNFKVTGGVLEVRPESKIIILADIVKE